MATERKFGGIVLISSHAFHATLEAPFSAAGWQIPSDTTFGVSNVNDVAYSPELIQYVAVGDSGKIATSVDSGFTWSQAPSPFAETNLYSSHYANGLYMVGGSTGKLATSPDGRFWTLQNSGFGASPILGITYYDQQNIWIICGGSGKLATSADGVSWTLRSSSFGSTFINTLFSSSNLVIAGGYDGKLATSADGINWTQRTSSFVFDTIFGLSGLSDGSAYVAVGDVGKVAQSSDGVTWSQVFPGTSFGATRINAVSGNNELYVAAGSLGKIATSTSGLNWKQRTSNLGTTTINSVYIAESSALAVGDSGQIAFSV